MAEISKVTLVGEVIRRVVGRVVDGLIGRENGKLIGGDGIDRWWRSQRRYKSIKKSVQ